MQLLKVEFEKNGYQYTQVYRDEKYAIYQQKDQGKHVAFEVVKILSRPETIIFGRSCPATEYYPGSQMWGEHAHTYHSIDKCHLKIEEWKMNHCNRISTIAA